VRVMLMLSDREEISRGLAEGLGYKEIALRLGRDPSVISRDVARHGGRALYRAAAADEAARADRERPKLFAVERSGRLRAVVCRALCRGWSPASIAGRLATDYPEDQAWPGTQPPRPTHTAADGAQLRSAPPIPGPPRTARAATRKTPAR